MLGWLRRQVEEYGRSGAWATVRRIHLEREPSCAACGRTKNLEVHHIQPYHERPELELDDGVDGTGLDGNLVSLCGDPCHFVFGHLLNYRRANKHVRDDAARFRQRTRELQETPNSSVG